MIKYLHLRQTQEEKEGIFLCFACAAACWPRVCCVCVFAAWVLRQLSRSACCFPGFFPDSTGNGGLSLSDFFVSYLGGNHVVVGYSVYPRNMADLVGPHGSAHPPRLRDAGTSFLWSLYFRHIEAVLKFYFSPQLRILLAFWKKLSSGATAYHHHFDWLIDFGCLQHSINLFDPLDWLVDLLVCLLIDWSIDWLIDWLLLLSSSSMCFVFKEPWKDFFLRRWRRRMANFKFKYSAWRWRGARRTVPTRMTAVRAEPRPPVKRKSEIKRRRSPLSTPPNPAHTSAGLTCACVLSSSSGM